MLGHVGLAPLRPSRAIPGPSRLPARTRPSSGLAKHKDEDESVIPLAPPGSAAAPPSSTSPPLGDEEPDASGTSVGAASAAVPGRADQRPREPAPAPPALHASRASPTSSTPPKAAIPRTVSSSLTANAALDVLRSRLPAPRELDDALAKLRQTLATLRASTSHRRQALGRELERQLGVLGLKINETTGYSDVEELKREVRVREDELRRLRAEARAAKLAYDEAVSSRSSSQRDLNALLERKHMWTDGDVARFTALVRSDHASNALVGATSGSLAAAEAAVDAAFTALTRAILERYHEEQVWSDKIRAVSTWAGIAAIVANLVVFVGAVAVVEPWKRRRLVAGLEERVGGMMASVQGSVDALHEKVGKLERGVAAQVAVGPAIERAPAVESSSGRPDGPVAHDSQAPTRPLPEYGQQPAWLAHLHVPGRIPHLPPALGALAEPSVERDVAIGAVGGAIVFTVLGWVARGLTG
ncbi:sensitivity to high expression protein she9 [Cryptotrichosporon argae]